MSSIEPIESFSAPPESIPFQVVSEEGDVHILRSLQALAIRSIIGSHRIGEQTEEGTTPIDVLLKKGEPFTPEIKHLVLPARFYGRVTGLSVTLADLSPEQAEQYLPKNARKFGQSILMHVVASATSTSAHNAGIFESQVLYWRKNREQPIASYIIPTSPIEAYDNFPIARKLVVPGAWLPDSEYVAVLDRSARLSDRSLRVRMGNGKARRMKKS